MILKHGIPEGEGERKGILSSWLHSGLTWLVLAVSFEKGDGQRSKQPKMCTPSHIVFTGISIEAQIVIVYN